MDKELNVLKINNTWEHTSLPKDHTAITSQWPFKHKYKTNGTVERPKVGLVIRGFNQQLSVDYKHLIPLC